MWTGGREGAVSGRPAWHKALGRYCETSQGTHRQTMSRKVSDRALIQEMHIKTYSRLWQKYVLISSGTLVVITAT